MDRQVDRDRTINGVGFGCPRQVGRLVKKVLQCWFIAGAAGEGSNGWMSGGSKRGRGKGKDINKPMAQ